MRLLGNLPSLLDEMWYAWRASRSNLLYLRRVSAEEPTLAGKALYEQVIVRRTGVERAAAAQTLLRAEQSLCQWPSQRELRFCDVVLYVVVEEYMRSHSTLLGTQANMLAIVSRVIPGEL
jgi:hypothetical protein